MRDHVGVYGFHRIKNGFVGAKSTAMSHVWSFANKCVLLNVRKLTAHAVEYDEEAPYMEDYMLSTRCFSNGLLSVVSYEYALQRPAWATGGCAPFHVGPTSKPWTWPLPA